MDKAIAESGTAIFESLKNHEYKGIFNTDNYSFEYVIFDENGFFGIVNVKKIEPGMEAIINDEYNTGYNKDNEEKISQGEDTSTSKLVGYSRGSTTTTGVDATTGYRGTRRTNYFRQDRGDTKEVGNTSFSLKKNNEENVNFSLSINKDNQGRNLSKKQKEYFKNSRAVDENGDLIVVYHRTTDAIKQFNEFNPVGTDYYR